MLPEELSADHLSLLPGEERCALTAEMRLDPEGTVLSVDVYESLIRSWGRVSYEEMARFLDEQVVLPAVKPVAEALPLFRAVAARLGIARLRRGGVQFAREEARVHLDPQTGAPTDLTSHRTTTAHQMIERMMVAANEALAGWMNSRGVPALYRGHEPPDAARTADLDAIARNFGFEAAFGGRVTPLSLAVLDSQIARTPWEGLVRTVMLRALGPARYTVEPRPHFGLAAPLYLHFTSPIRRYADLAVHRAVKRYLHGQRPEDALDRAVGELAGHVNERSTAASRAERDRTRVLAARWLADRVGTRHAGRITRVRASGLTVQLETGLVEGVIPVEGLPGGPYRADDREIALEGGRQRFVIGMPLAVRIRAVDADVGRIELELDDQPAPKLAAPKLAAPPRRASPRTPPRR
jgi:ribonuclease R